MSLLRTTIYLTCLMTSLVNGGSELKIYCYDPPGLTCAEQHILDCDEGQVITTDISNFRVSFLKNKNYPECQTEKDECKNKTTCCKYINDSVTVQKIRLLADDVNLLINFIKTECSSKSSCIVSSYYNTIGGPALYDYVTYNYGCISAKDEITVDFLLNGSTKFTGSSIPSNLYYLDYNGNGAKDNDVILNRECFITTERDITLTIKTLNLQADGCCRFYISGYNFSEYCSENGSLTPPKGKYIDNNSASIRLENVVNKYGDSFSILVKVAGIVTIDCRAIRNVEEQESTTYQYPKTESSSISSSSSTVVSSTNSLRTSPPKTAERITEDRSKEDSETNLAGIIGGIVGGLVVLVAIIIIVVVIMRRREKQQKTTDVLANTSGNGQQSEYAYIDIGNPGSSYTNITGNNVVQNGTQRIFSDINYIKGIPKMSGSKLGPKKYPVLEDNSRNEKTYYINANYLGSDEAQTSTCDKANIADDGTYLTPCSSRICDTAKTAEDGTYLTPCNSRTRDTVNIADNDIYLTPCSTST